MDVIGSDYIWIWQLKFWHCVNLIADGIKNVAFGSKLANRESPANQNLGALYMVDWVRNRCCARLRGAHVVLRLLTRVLSIRQIPFLPLPPRL